MRINKASTLIAAVIALSCTGAFAQGADIKGLFCPVKERVSVVEFEASWCRPCKMMKPVWESLRRDYEGRVSIVHIDIDENQAIAQAFRISAVPTQFLFDKGCRFVDAHAGYISEADLRATFEAILKSPG